MGTQRNGWPRNPRKNTERLVIQKNLSHENYRLYARNRRRSCVNRTHIKAVELWGRFQVSEQANTVLLIAREGYGMNEV